jgi:hypothetical protein
VSLGEKTPLCKSLDNADIEHISDERSQRVLSRVVFTTHTSRSLRHIDLCGRVVMQGGYRGDCPRYSTVFKPTNADDN